MRIFPEIKTDVYDQIAGFGKDKSYFYFSEKGIIGNRIAETYWTLRGYNKEPSKIVRIVVLKHKYDAIVLESLVYHYENGLVLYDPIPEPSFRAFLKNTDEN